MIKFDLRKKEKVTLGVKITVGDQEATERVTILKIDEAGTLELSQYPYKESVFSIVLW